MSSSTSTSPATTSERLDSIDALRGLAAMMVALYHVWGHYGIYPWPSIGVVTQATNPSLWSYIVSPMRWGYLGVSLFLVLSGFCIHLPLARRKEKSGDYGFEAKTFYLRRMWRLYPAYFVSVVGTFVLLYFSYHFAPGFVASVPLVSDLFAHLTFLHGFFDDYFYGIVHVYWSIALEFQLYLAYPIFLWLFRKAGLSRSILLLTVIALVWRAVAMQVFHFNLISISPTGPYSMMGSVVARMPEWLFGVWLAEWYASGKHTAIRRGAMTTASIATLVLALASTLWEPAWVATDILFGVGFAFTVAAVAIPGKRTAAATEGGRFYRLLVYLGTISYSIYLFHHQLSWFGNTFISSIPGEALPFILRWAVLGVSIPVIAWIFRYVERPFLRLPKPGEKYWNLHRRIRQVLGIKTDTGIPVQLGGSASR